MRRISSCLGVGLVLTAAAWCAAAERPTDAEILAQPGIVKAQLIYEEAPFPQCHASTIEQAADGSLVASWFGGTHEKNPDVCIWVSRNEGQGWTVPEKVADGVWSDGKRYPTWNPVLFQPKSGPLALYYKVGPTPSDWWGMMLLADEKGRFAGAKPKQLPKGFLGPIKNKPIQLADGTILCPTSDEANGWQAYFEMTDEPGDKWTKTAMVEDPGGWGPIQPTLLTGKDGKIIALNRIRKGGMIIQTVSADGGKTWSPLEQTALPNPNSGIDAVTLADGRHLLVYNHTTQRSNKWGGSRKILNVAVSDDDAKTWKAALVLEMQPQQKGEFSYPAVIQSDDGLVHITYTYKRKRVKHVVVDPSKLVLREMPEGRWPEPAVTPK